MIPSPTALTGVLFILVGPSGAGKNSLMNRAIARVDDLWQMPTATTRARRIDEMEGREHFFVTRDAFQEMIDANDLLEWQVVHRVNLYGMVRNEVEKALRNGSTVIADIEVQGARAAKSAFPSNVVIIFVMPPTLGDLIERLNERDEPPHEITRRLLRVPMEYAYLPECDYVIVNDNLEDATNSLVHILNAERYRASRARDARRAAAHSQQLARVHITYQGMQLHAPGTRLDIWLSEDELPQHAAARALSLAFGEPPRGTWWFGGESQNNIDPPTRLYTEGRPERVVYEYRYELTQHVPAPSGWVWAAETILETTPVEVAL